MVCYPFCFRHALLVLACLSVFACRAQPVDSSSAASDVSYSEKSDRERLVWLRSEVSRHDHLYYKKAAPEISDFEYDELKRELRRLERSFPDLAELKRVGDDRSGLFPNYSHGVPMLSLEKAYSNSELYEFVNRTKDMLNSKDVTYIVEPKIDGIAISVTYENGKFVRAVTRGNGTVGDDISENVLTVLSIPHELHRSSSFEIPELIELRGELFVTFADFEELNRVQQLSGKAAFANPRSLAAGSAKLKDSSEAARRPLSAVFFGYGAYKSSELVPSTQRSFYEQARAWGLPTLVGVRVASDFDAMNSAIAQANADRIKYPFPTDGVVVKVDLVAFQQKLGSSEFAPRWALAYKFTSTQVKTRLRAITLQIGRTGLVTPVAEFDPVQISGSRVVRASLYNKTSIAQKDIRIGDMVIVEKAGDIIPTIVGVDLEQRAESSLPYGFPLECPSCGARFELFDKESAIRCINANCPAQLQRRLEYFASSKCVGIKGLGSAMIEKLIARGWVTRVSDIYKLERGDLLSLGVNMEVSTDKLLLSISRSKRADLWRFIRGLGIPKIGIVRAKSLARSYGSFEALLRMSSDDFAVNGRAEHARLGAAAELAVLAYFAESSHRELVAELLAAGVQPRVAE